MMVGNSSRGRIRAEGNAMLQGGRQWVRRVPVLLALLVPGAAAAQPGAALDQARALESRDPDAALTRVRQLLPTLPDSLRGRGHELRCWMSAGILPESAAVFAEAGLVEARARGDSVAAVSMRLCRATGQFANGDPVAATAELEAALPAARRLRDRSLVARALVLRGEMGYYRGDFAGAARDLDEGYRLHVALHDSARMRYALNAMANLYADARVGQFERATEFYRILLREYQRLGNQREVAVAYFNLGGTEERKGNLEAALGHYRRALAIDLRLDPNEAAYDRRAIGIVLYKLNRPAEALAVLDLALARYLETGEMEMVASTRLSRGVALRMLGRVGESLRELEAARARFASTGNRRFLEKVHEERALSYAAGGQWDSAYAARTAQLELQRALEAESRDEQSARIRVQFDAEHREEENRRLARENALRGQALAAAGRIRRLQLAVILLSLAIIGALAVMIVRQVAGARRLSVLALTDELTRMPNRRHVLMIGEEHFRAARKRGAGYSIVMLDLDHFKAINDSFGHDVGDAVLRRVAEVFRQSLRAEDRMGRLGGEEFIAVLPGASASDAREVAERVRRSVEATDMTPVHPEVGTVTVSVGVAAYSPIDRSFAALCHRADDSLYRAKEAGRNRVVVDG
jgi:diguanylate cyclase (GGDEF)-like protein